MPELRPGRRLQADRRRRFGRHRYSLGLIAVTSSPFLWGTLGLPSLLAALALDALFLGLAVGLRREPTPRRAALRRHFSLLYLTLLFAAIASESVL